MSEGGITYESREHLVLEWNKGYWMVNEKLELDVNYPIKVEIKTLIER